MAFPWPGGVKLASSWLATSTLPGILYLIAATLQLAGYTFSSHQTGYSLLDTLFSTLSSSGTVPYDLVIVDLLLPGPLSGMEVILRIRARLSAEQLPIVLLTAGGTSLLENVASMLPQDVVWVQKPFYPRTLVETVRQLLTEQ